MTEITINGDCVFLESNNLEIDYSNHLNLISKELALQEKGDKKKVIGIEGITGSGKSMLAKVLESTGTNTCLIDVCEILDFDTNYLDISALVKDPKKTYIIDEIGLVSPQTIDKSLNKILSENRVLILLYQTERDIPESVKTDIVKLKLTRKELKKKYVKAHQNTEVY